jgi:hypothetical protein
MRCRVGDLATIVNSTNGPNGASCGAIVQCLKVVGDHSLYGPVWRVSSRATLVSEFGGVGNTVDVPDCWLEKLTPPSTVENSKKVEELSI